MQGPILISFGLSIVCIWICWPWKWMVEIWVDLQLTRSIKKGRRKKVFPSDQFYLNFINVILTANSTHITTNTKCFGDDCIAGISVTVNFFARLPSQLCLWSYILYLALLSQNISALLLPVHIISVDTFFFYGFQWSQTIEWHKREWHQRVD